MVNEITPVSADGVQGLGRSVPSGPSAPRPQRVDSMQEPPSSLGPPSALVQTHNAAYANLAAVKDDAAMVAQSVRKTADALAKAKQMVRAMQAEVGTFIKQYPPFPPGSEERLNYLNSISTLRKQLEDMTIPPPADRIQPIYYPRETDLPALDPATASDEDVLAFARALDGVARRIDASFKQLERLVEALPVNLGLQLSTQSMEEHQAVDAIQTIVGQLPDLGDSFLFGVARLAQLDG